MTEKIEYTDGYVIKLLDHASDKWVWGQWRFKISAENGIKDYRFYDKVIGTKEWASEQVRLHRLKPTKSRLQSLNDYWDSIDKPRFSLAETFCQYQDSLKYFVKTSSDDILKEYFRSKEVKPKKGKVALHG